MDDKTLRIIDESGQEHDYEIVLTFRSDETGKNYVVYKEMDDDSDEVYAAEYTEEDDDGGRLRPIETDAEWDMIEEVLESFAKEEEAKKQ